MTKARKWMVAGLIAALALVALAVLVSRANNENAATRLAKLPAGARNVAVFDAAMGLLKSNYYDPSLFQQPRWKEYEASYRKKAAGSPAGPMFYANLLDNFARGFPDSHFRFEAPRAESKPADFAPVKVAARTPAIQARAQQFERMLAMFEAGPGFDSVTIRRGDRTQSIVGEVVRGSVAERAGVAPGWAMSRSNVDMNADRVHIKATFIPLTPDLALSTERTALPPASPVREIEFDYEPFASRTDFETRKLASGATYLRFDNCSDWSLVSKALDVIDAAGPAGLVIDLRHNYGGNGLHMARVIGHLLGSGEAVGTTRANGANKTVLSIKLVVGHYQGPLVVLIGPSTMSAAEIIAAAVQDHKRGTLVGRMTNGSVVQGKMFDLPDGGQMMIPISDFVRMDNRRIEGLGVSPDVWILPTLEDVRAGRDPVLERAMLAN